MSIHTAVTLKDDRHRAGYDAAIRRIPGAVANPIVSKQLADVSLRARCGKSAGSDLECQHRPDPTHHKRKQTDSQERK